jgi:glycine cleavage system protein P-like pyridoxal-binding family
LEAEMRIADQMGVPILYLGLSNLNAIVGKLRPGHANG